jgi:hypothetical protein
MTLGRLTHFFHTDPRCFGLKAINITRYFILANIVSFIVPGVRGSMFNPENSLKTA